MEAAVAVCVGCYLSALFPEYLIGGGALHEAKIGLPPSNRLGTSVRISTTSTRSYSGMFAFCQLPFADWRLPMKSDQVLFEF